MRFRCWLAVLLLAASSLSACRKYVEKPPDGPGGVGGSAGTGGTGGTAGRGGAGGTGGTSGSSGTGGTPDVAMPMDTPPADVADVLMSDRPDTMNCGMSGQSCCPINSCQGNACCVDGMCVQVGNACFPGNSCYGASCGGCGGMNERCCQNSLCVAPNNVCVAGDAGATCRKCGGPNEACCAGNTCSDNRMCMNNTCVQRTGM
jgi:hypothetical protein